MNERTPNEEKKLFLLDAYALIYRAYFAFIRNPRINSGGMNTSAIFGFVNTLDEILKKEKPTHIAVVFDPPGPTFRHEMFVDYKAQREATPEDIKIAIPYIKKIIEGFQIPVVEVKGYEADDVIGTLARQAAYEGFFVYMVTPDKDYTQLVTDRVFLYKPRKSGNDPEVWDTEEVKKAFGVERPEQVIDILALWGDSADNIPGAPGVGEVTSKKLIQEFGNVENLLKNTGALKGKQKENIENNKKLILLCKKLVTIEQNVDIVFNADAYKKSIPDIDKLKPLFETLEFKNMLQRVMKIENPSTSLPKQASLFDKPDSIEESEPITTGFKNITNVKHTYHLVDTAEKRKALIQKLASRKYFCFDTETTSLDVLKAEIVGISFSIQPGEAWYVPCSENFEKARKELEEFKEIFSDVNIEKLGQNIKYDLHILKNYGMDVAGNLFDTMIAHYLLQPDQRHNLDRLSETYLNYRPVAIEELIGKKGANQMNMRSVPVEKIKEYAAEDADLTLQLKEILAPKLKSANLHELASQIEMPLIPVLISMERTGVKLDAEALKENATGLEKEIKLLEKKIQQQAGIEFNVSSPKQLGEILFERLKIVENARRTKSKQYSTSEDVLSKLKNKHKIISDVLEFRSLKKLLNTYVDALPKLTDPQTGKLHTSFNQAIAATGRLSSTNPNLQNIPIREERGREIRKAFIPSGPDYLLLSADYSQIELRIMAHMSEDQNMIRAFLQDEDIHADTASRIYKTPIEEVTREMRSHAKTANFGIIYGISAFGLSQRLNIPRADARNLIEGYFESYPGVKKYMDASIQKAKEVGFVETIMGRKRILNDIHSRNAVVRSMAERNAINAPIQGSAADIIKKAMIGVQGELERYQRRSKMILQVHDELIFDVWKPELEAVQQMVIHEMEQAISLKVPLKVDFGVGKNWLEAH